jgi:hypothetical protein
MHELYTASEAIAKLKLPRSTFYYLVEQGEIPKIVVPLRKQAYYARSVIDALAQQREAVVEEYRTQPERVRFLRPTGEDLEQLVAIDRTIWGEVGIIDSDAISARFSHNPDCVHVLKDVEANTVLGGVTMSPLRAGLIERLVSLEVDESELTANDYLPFTNEHSLECYVIGIVARQDVMSPYYASLLLRHASDFLVELAEQGVTVTMLFTVATTHEGEQLARKLGFTEMVRGTGPLGDNRVSLSLDLDQQKPVSDLVARYQAAVKNRKRRAKRHQAEQKSA